MRALDEPDDETPRQRSERFLELLGLPRKEPADVEAVIRLLDGVITRGGQTRRRRLENCGVAFPVMTAEQAIAWERRGCRDRFCPECAHALSQQHAAAIRDFWAAREAAGARGLFITLTQPKLAGEAPRSAVQRLLQTWRQICNARTKLANGLLRSRSKKLPIMLPGGVRAVEVTARAQGTQIRGPDGIVHTVQVGGTHAHLHIVAELAPGVTPNTAAARIIRAWTEVSGGRPAAQDIQLITAGNIYQVTKYAADFGNLAELIDVAPAYARSVVIALHGVRLIEPWGTWRGVLKKPKSGLRFGDRSVAALCMCCEGDVRFGPIAEPATQVLAALAGGAERYGEIRRAEKAEARERIAWAAELARTR